MQNFSAAMNWFIIKVSGKINTCWNLKQIKISLTPHNLTGTHLINRQLDSWVISSRRRVCKSLIVLMSYLWHGTLRCSAAEFSSLQPPTLQTAGTGPHFVSSPTHYESWDHESESDHGRTLRFDNSKQELKHEKMFQLTWGFKVHYYYHQSLHRLNVLTHFSSLNSSGFPSQGLFVVRKSLFVYLAWPSLSSLAWLMVHCQICEN